ncbi:4-hydroxybenzoate polyprenyltransferase [Cryobacterium sp. MP_M5]|uniref:hypothetical protein n=1 Tax=unclassified Cryobacterium TaxID=2649013 RepID=UPI0018CBE2E9|nr:MULTISPECIES: hypothetical protein [unclassified Cryobacterium]MBG6060153.1 4-hydroxybenzoate polyprenyltransferase [Cryobacterium sp. MP_M3]MEC5178589.1 4-hydroxybenzoate polyprenyltransferase [Cryobacterium sp. MP_M5]
MNANTDATGPPRAPTSHYVLGAVFGAVVTIALSLAVGASNPEHFWIAAAICALCALYPSVSLGMRIFVSENTIRRDAHGEESVELTWMRQASAGAFLDVMVTTIVGSVLLMFAGPVIEALPALLALIGLSAVDVGLRYAIIRHRATR